jgi:dTDP-4-dehydrorhamnose reductase
MKLLLAGANGQVGHELRRALAPLGEVVAATRDGTLDDDGVCERADLAQPETLVALLDRVRPDVIVNAAAYTAVDRAEDEAALAMRVNGEAVGVFGQWAAAHGARVVHYSTDYVFDGNATRPWREDDAVAPLGVYGRSKLAGERALRDSGADHLLFRTAWVYAARGHNFLRTMLRLGAERERLSVVDDQRGTPTPAALIADVTAAALKHWLDGNDATQRALKGTYNLVATGETTWCGFARAIMQRAATAGLLARAPEVAAISSAEFPTPAQRPAYSVLDTTRLRETFGIALPTWQHGLDAVIAELQAGTNRFPLFTRNI